MRQTIITRQMQIDFTIHNVGVRKSRDEYAEHPIASCPYDDCFNLLAFGERMCSEHFELLTGARDRMRALRASRRAS